MLGLRHFLTSTTGCGGSIRQELEDFQVEEILPYEFSGHGEYTVVKIEKRGLSTLEARSRIARALGIHPQRVSYAGLKDTRAITTQYFSLHQVTREQALALRAPGIAVKDAFTHHRKVKIGKLFANRFTIRIRKCDAAAGEAAFMELQASGVPNVIGWQRFGGREGTTHLLGEAIIKGSLQDAVSLLLAPCPDAAACYQSGDTAGALQLLPSWALAQRTALLALNAGTAPAQALRRIDKGTRWLYIAAFQSWLFNEILDRRMAVGLGVQEGDLMKTYYGLATPSGLYPGRKTPLAGGIQGEIERDVLDAHQLDQEAVPSDGKRRPLLFPMWDTSHESEGSDLVLHFTLPKGCFATAVLREVMKSDVV
ncbi:MAG: tRNA pseudouridine(13) synthase TruD [Candidatus Aenigmarchaeota archaeon]|nr:tRNA pseudouridine(13) synthase TruD [Candidatus Aenigmarchaeota archaeon]